MRINIIQACVQHIPATKYVHKEMVSGTSDITKYSYQGILYTPSLSNIVTVTLVGVPVEIIGEVESIDTMKS